MYRDKGVKLAFFPDDTVLAFAKLSQDLPTRFLSVRNAPADNRVKGHEYLLARR